MVDIASTCRRFKALVVVTLLAGGVPALLEAQQNHHWPEGSNVCSGFWLFQPFLQERSSCRAPAHGREPEQRQVVEAWQQDTLNRNFRQSCLFSFSSRNSGGGFESTRIAVNKVNAAWDNVAWADTLQGVELRQVAGSRWTISCRVTVWDTPEFVLRTSPACPLALNKAKVDPTKIGVRDAMWPEPNELGIRGRCVSCDDLPTSNTRERKQKVACLLQTLRTPRSLVQLQPGTSGSGNDIDWDAEIKRDAAQAVRAFRSLAVSTLYAKKMVGEFGKEFDPTDLAAVNGLVSEYRQRLPLIQRVFEINVPPQGLAFREGVSRIAAVIALI